MSIRGKTISISIFQLVFIQKWLEVGWMLIWLQNTFEMLTEMIQYFSLSMIHCQVFGYTWLADCMYTEANFTSILEMYKGWINTKCWVYFACCFGQLSAAGKVLICYRHANNPLFWLITVYGPASFKVIPRGRSKYA